MVAAASRGTVSKASHSRRILQQEDMPGTTPGVRSNFV